MTIDQSSIFCNYNRAHSSLPLVLVPPLAQYAPALTLAFFAKSEMDMYSQLSQPGYSPHNYTVASGPVPPVRLVRFQPDDFSGQLKKESRLCIHTEIIQPNLPEKFNSCLNIQLVCDYSLETPCKLKQPST